MEGVTQAQVLLKAIVINELPAKLEESLTKQNIPTIADLAMQQSVMAACVFDAEQKKTAIVKLADRPAYVLPRGYGITDARRK
jgi:large subunit ribosomal protein L37